MKDKKESKRDKHGGEDAWGELYGYVKNSIMKLPYECTIPHKLILKLDGLSKGIYISNNKLQPMATYQYKDILTAFKLAEFLMRNKTDFKSSEHRFNYAMTIVESKLNDIVKARKEEERQKDKIANIDMGVHTNEKAEYKPAPSTKLSPEMEELW